MPLPLPTETPCPCGATEPVVLVLLPDRAALLGRCHSCGLVLHGSLAHGARAWRDAPGFILALPASEVTYGPT